eukprot:TRINITY_DN19557_c0_g1_i1.p1 TRINITY_DN19557_c0_g1~~TRINITY_DN19557_c0_g1_i1.p1  ORF type:complete len:184 (-),score=29.55 TRINITY_DN19557_c0_g1_i1:8-559(-)
MCIRDSDWRLAANTLEQRDGYFTKLKAQIGIMVERSGHKAVLLAHSLGGTIALYFLHFVAAQPSGDQWLSEHIHAVTGIGAAWLGAPKTLAAVISGEMKDTATLGTLEAYAVNSLVTREQRLAVMRTWSGLAALLPKGGDAVWGTSPAMIQSNNSQVAMNATRAVQQCPLYPPCPSLIIALAV